MSSAKTRPRPTPASATEGSKEYPHHIEIIQPAPIERLAEAYRNFEEFKSRLLNENDYVDIGGKKYLRKSAWRKWALACSVSDELVSIERVPPDGRDKEGSFLYRVIARAVHKPTGRSAVGLAVASSAEKKAWAHEEHDVLTLAHTRAKNRAIADLVGSGEISAEEVAPPATEETHRTSPGSAPSTMQPTQRS